METRCISVLASCSQLFDMRNIFYWCCCCCCRRWILFSRFIHLATTEKKWHGISCHIYHHCLISISARQSIYRFIRSLLCLRGVARVFVIIICVSVVSAFISQPQSLQYYLVHNLCGPATKFHFFFHSSSLHNKIYGRFPFNFRAYCILEDIASAEETPKSEWKGEIANMKESKKQIRNPVYC